ncbi:hypothetical protein CRG98_011937 [Punica granatum]|uniref:VPS35 endosomal protein sorting factor-like n=1 Tax=Punica granatum TaxID=22663 RepID=A0A2I0KGW0_PUNGR|nr:hypothetical protein CRG98_011937 [Punica granatum]
MEFRARDYKAESEAHALPRKRADGDPLSAPAVDIVEDKGEEFFDPLREPNSNVVGSLDTEDDIGHPSVVVSTEVPGQENAKREWTSFKRFLMQRFPVSKMVSISAMSDGILRSGKGYEKLSMSTDPDELDDSQKFSEEGIRSIARQEYISRLKEFKEKFADAWQSGDRVTSLKLAIKVAKLLTDTSVGQFYPTLFVLATDIMEMLGDMVWERVKQKAEYAEDGTFLCSLPASFRADDVGLDAKETCNNWFCKIGSVKELLPRIYLELALLPCWRFLVDQPIDSIQRLVMMARGVADPLACSYCRLYIARCAQKLPSVDTGMIHLVSIASSGLRKLLESAVVEFGLGNTEAHGSNPSISIIVHNLIKELPVDMVNSKTIDIINLIECCNDYTLDQCLNYRLLGFRLSESKYSLHIVTVVDRVIRVVSQKDMLDEYLKVVDAYVDLIFQNHMDDHLVKILDGISKRICNKGMVGDELACLQSILVKLLSHFKNLEDIFSLNHFLEILDMMYGRSRMIVNMHILDKATRGGLICDPTTIQLLFEVSQALNDSIDQVNVRDEDLQQPARMISRFIDKVSYGADRERHLAFLVECRRAFGSTNELKETLVHSSNSLAVKALIERKNHLDFLKSCIAFSEVTISSVTALVRQLKLYLETAEVALLGGLVSHSDGLVQSAISCMQSVDLVDVSRGPTDADETLNFLQKICGFLIILPGNPEKGAVYTPKSLFALLNSQSWMTPRMRARICCAMISLSATLSQKNLPYHASKSGIPSNDILFYGNSAYFGELVSFSEEVVRKLVDAIKQEPSPVARGSMALEACNCIALSFKVS